MKAQLTLFRRHQHYVVSLKQVQLFLTLLTTTRMVVLRNRRAAVQSKSGVEKDI